jgi:hypothetical protein
MAEAWALLIFEAFKASAWPNMPQRRFVSSVLQCPRHCAKTVCAGIAPVGPEITSFMAQPL